MSDFTDYLRRFNSEERFYLLGYILGNPGLRPASSSLEQISGVLGLRIPEDAFAAMDFHLDWLYASLHMAFAGGKSGVIANQGANIAGQQEDIDYLIAFEQGGTHSVVLIDAKAKSAWSASQLESKARRLSKIFGHDGKHWRKLDPYFILLSPRRPVNLDVSKWPSWMCPNGRFAWIELPIPGDLLKVTRCDGNGKPHQSGASGKSTGADSCLVIGLTSRQTV